MSGANPLSSVPPGPPSNPLESSAGGTVTPISTPAPLAAPVQPLKMSRWGRNNEQRRMEIEFRKDPLRSSRPFGIDPDGQAHYAGPFHPEKAYLERSIEDYIRPLGEGKYARTSLSKADFKHLAAGTHRGSKNHATGETEGGLSVSRTLEFPGKYAYLVSGDEIGRGSDHEPLLDVRTARPASKLMTGEAFQQMQQKALSARLKELGLSREAYLTLVTGHKRIVAPGNAVHDEIV